MVVRTSKEGETIGRVPVVAFRGVAGSRPPGQGWRPPDGIPPVNPNLVLNWHLSRANWALVLGLTQNIPSSNSDPS